MTRLVQLVLFALMIVGFAPMAGAHEVNPAYLEIKETTPGHYSVLWKQPIKDGRRLKIDPVFPDGCEKQNISVSPGPGTIVERWQTTCDLSSATIAISGLDRTLIDVFVRLERNTEEPLSAVLRPGHPALELSAPIRIPVFAYLRLGVDHILFGFDHLLFVLGLMLIVQARQILLTLTSFTIAHSITLALSALAGLSLPGPPVEIAIAMSIVLLAVEALHYFKGQSPLSVRYPWAIAFGFGLLHGFGFAGALASIGLPAGTEVLALGLFNLGVELGQILFVGAVLIGSWLITRLARLSLPRLQHIAAYGVGIAGTYWVIERLYNVFLPLI